jgi:hypothetical protein
MKHQAKRKISRRRMLKGSVAATAMALANAFARRKSLTVQADDDYPYKTYLPFISAPVRPHGPSKLGMHTILQNEALTYIRLIAQQGAHLAVVKAVDHFSWLEYVKQDSPQTLNVGRSTAFHDTVDLEGDLATEAQQAMDVILPEMELHREYVDYWEITNEMDPPGVDGYRKHAEIHFHFMDIAEREGFKTALFTWNAGTPEWEEMEAVVETGVFARAKEGGHILSLHEATFAPPVTTGYGEPLPGRPRYANRGTLCCRYRWLYEDFLKPRNEVIPLLMTEFIVGAYADIGYTPSEWMAQIAWYDDRMREDDYVIGCCPFTLGPVGGWGTHDWEAALPDYAQYIISLKDQV